MSADWMDKSIMPTPKRLADARKKGAIAKSHDLASSMILLGTVVLIYFWAAPFGKGMVDLLTSLLSSLDAPVDDSGFIIDKMHGLIFLLLEAALPFFAGVVILAIFANLLQTHGLVSLHPLLPKWSRLNPFDVDNFQRIFGWSGIAKVGFNLIRIGVALVISVGFIAMELPVISGLSSLPVPRLVRFLFEMTLSIGAAIAIAYLAVGIADYCFQRWKYRRDLMMTPRELKDESKLLEGDRTIRNKIAAAMKSFGAKQSFQRVMNADVMIADGSRVAVAVSYPASKSVAPRCVAKGANERARHLLKLAEKYKVPIVENPFLAQALFKETPTDGNIDPQHYAGVAKALIQVDYGSGIQ